MEAVLIEAQNESEVKFWLTLAKKTGARARSVKSGLFEDKFLVGLIEEGMRTKNVSRRSVLKALDQ